MEGLSVYVRPAATDAVSDSLLSSIAADLPRPDVDTYSCSLMGPFGLVIQGLMGCIVLGSLLVKRQREWPRRKFPIWTADVSKQITGQAFVHFLNLAISASIASLPTGGNPCALYFINIFVDTTIGVFILYLTLRLCNYVLSVTLGLPLSDLGLISGHYPAPFLASWLRQLGVYLTALFLMKISVILLFVIGGEQLVRFGDGIIEWISRDARVQVFVSIMLGPTLLNVLQFLIIDSLIRHKGEALTSEILETDEEAHRRFISDSDGERSDHQETDAGERGRRRSFHRARRPGTPPGTSSKGSTSGNGARDKVGVGYEVAESPTNKFHAYPPRTPSRSSSHSTPKTSPEKVQKPKNAEADGDGWDDDGWGEWDEDGADGEGDVIGKRSSGGPSRVEVTPLKMTRTFATGRREKDEIGGFGSPGTPGTPRIVVTEAF